MRPSDERGILQREIEAPLSRYGIRSSNIGWVGLSPEESRKIQDIAFQVLRGNIDSQELSKLNPNQKAALDLAIKQLLGLKDKPGLQELEERNPYYTAFSSGLVRDGSKPEEG